ncbi:hypothetical protein [Ferrovibrio sp.]|uniref:hypothetical protein n=1 Tax=Ferrovibrio sp. TaxID=1917215 RepID=UPI003D2E6AC8
MDSADSLIANPIDRQQWPFLLSVRLPACLILALIPTDNGRRGATGFQATVISKAGFLTADE